MATTFLSVTEVAKLVRQALKEAFPDIRFGVRSSRYAGGASLSVSWRDGPNEAQVTSITDRFRGSYFDGTTDYQGSRYSMIDGQLVSFGADYIHTRRSYSRRTVERVVARIAPRYGLVAYRLTGDDEYGWGMTSDDFRESDKVRVVQRALYRQSDRLRIERCPTAARVIYCGNDGYSDVGALALDD